MYENKLPVALTTINNPINTVNIQVEARKVKLVDAVTPTANNMWSYVPVPFAAPPASNVLHNHLGPIINVRRGAMACINWINTLGPMPMMPGMQDEPPIFPRPMGMMMGMPNMQPSVGIVTHLHGAKVLPSSDGWPLDPVGYMGNPYGLSSTRGYEYINDQRAAMLWFHDHAMDNTAVQVHAGLSGLYFVRDSSDDAIAALIKDPQIVAPHPQELPLVIQDRNLECGYDQFNYSAGVPSDMANPNAAPDGYVRTEFLGESIFVNGRATPHHEAMRSVYRLRILNGSNARTYALALIDPFWWNRMGQSRLWYSDCLRVIGNDGGLFTKSVRLPSTGYVLIAPGERLDVLLDLTDAALKDMSRLRLVNLAVASALGDPGVEGIFQSDAVSVLKGANGQAGPANDADPTLCNALKLGQANVMQFCLDPMMAPPPAAPGSPTALNVAALDAILAAHADEDGFARNGLGKLDTSPAATPVARNRFVLCMNNTTGSASSNPSTLPNGPDTAPNPHPLYPTTIWKDTQMWELSAAPASPTTPTWKLPFDIDTETANPVPGAPLASKGYVLKRATFFNTEFEPSIATTGHYPPVHANPTYMPKQGTYERWYVANVGNMQPVVPASGTGVTPDMHPFHMHVVNFVVQRRWQLDATGTFVEQTTPRALEFDGISRHDTVRVQSNELLELLVYFPPNYTGRYPYHCHLVEHEDMGMMLHFEVVV